MRTVSRWQSSVALNVHSQSGGQTTQVTAHLLENPLCLYFPRNVQQVTAGKDASESDIWIFSKTYEPDWPQLCPVLARSSRCGSCLDLVWNVPLFIIPFFSIVLFILFFFYIILYIKCNAKSFSNNHCLFANSKKRTTIPTIPLGSVIQFAINNTD